MIKNKMMYAAIVTLFSYSYNSGMKPIIEQDKIDLCEAIKNDDRQIVAQIIKADASTVSYYYRRSEFKEEVTPFFVAVYYNRNACLKMLLATGEEIYDSWINDYSPLHYVGNVKGAQLLINYGVNVNKKTKDGITPFACAIDKNLFDVAEFLLEKGADINARYGRDNNSALHKAVLGKDVKKVEFLLSHNADFSQRDAQGKTPFAIAIESESSCCYKAIQDKEIQVIRRLFEKYGMVFFPQMTYKELFQDPFQWKDPIADDYRRTCFRNWARLFAAVKKTR